MSIEVTNVGSGSFGEIAPGWTVNEFATPVTIGQSAGGSGNVSFNAKANDDTLFVVNNRMTTTEQDLGSISGVVTAVSQNGIAAGISHNTKLAQFDSELDIPALGAGGVVPALDVCNQLIKNDVRLLLDEGRFYSLAGHSQGFDPAGDLVQVEFKDSWNITYLNLADPALTVVDRFTGNIGAVDGGGFFSRNDKVYASTVQGDWFNLEYWRNRNTRDLVPSYMFFKTLLDSNVLELNLSGREAYPNERHNISLKLSKAAATASFTGTYIYDVNTENISVTKSLASLDLDAELAVFFETKTQEQWGPYGIGGTFVLSGSKTFLKAVICNTTDYNTTIIIEAEFLNGANGFIPTFNGSRWVIRQDGGSTATLSGVRSLYRSDVLKPSYAVNYVKNPGFENPIVEWTETNGIGTINQSTDAFYGTKSMRVTPTTGTPSSGQYILEYDIDLAETGTDFDTLSVLFKSSGSGVVQLNYATYDSLGVIVDSYNLSPPLQGVGSNWVRSTIPRIATSQTAVTAKISILYSWSVSAGSTLYVDGIMLSSPLPSVEGPFYFDGGMADTDVYEYSYDANGLSVRTPVAGSYVKEYENESTSFSYDTINLGPAVPSYSGNAWTYLQDACSAYGEEIALVNDQITVRGLGGRELSFENVAGAPNISPRITLTGRSVNINYTNAEHVTGELYSALADNNRVLSVNANETVVTTIELNATPTIINKPVRVSTIPAGGKLPVGAYAISPNNNAVIVPNLWEDHGGDLYVRPNKDNPNAVDVYLIGPDNIGNIFGGDTASYPGPYKVAFTDGGTDFGALSISGNGVVFKNETVNIRTAADPEKIPQEVATSVTNPFIATLEQAYDRGIWVSEEASGPVVSLSGSVPVSELSGFGLTAGSLVKYRDSIYRVKDANIGNLAVGLNLSRFVLVDDFDQFWDGRTVGMHDEQWSTYDTSDQVIAPLKFVGDDESVIMLLDTDVNPYYDFVGEPDISVFPDTDYNPYYELGGRIDGEDEVRLDTDNNPYDDGEGYGS